MMRGTLTEDPGDLQIGDEIITNAGAQMRCFVVEEVPRVSKKKAWYNGTKRYVAVKCRVAMEFKTSTGFNAWNKTPWTRTYKTYEFRVPNENDPITKVDLNFKQIYIINRHDYDRQ
jgi:hypothetical protein